MGCEEVGTGGTNESGIWELKGGQRIKSLTITLIVKEVQVTVWPEFGGNALHNLSWAILFIARLPHGT